ncbi:MAG: hypothetical protein QF674_07925 [Candidatus Marinimicrobia bacterium]|jgi:hypothetical protein|nr:hypothetical protein [Candidatus Neomarinimicrobiota bacterium]MDP7482820.1 hypothetical protein [Candidatus Neomarinimicrobiota bacterium]MDP7529400.1 hypothetical protein [Candidatus Neomarinimicrobiota bacterium]MDP7716643.1 hypothetical protein [Candidatus Neomarinimicrobiota bacterium]HJM09843.1 hypothetical protein [Candidatus Neomarinimicrobiota bacterium]|tara:strand:- start:925 stop:1443 length:519 start_codon:yes stop_codon:yes gene_type:complete
MTYRLLHANHFWVPLSTLVVITMMGCNSQGNAELGIDQRSYNLGGIGAFGEMVDAGVKKLALSAALSPENMDAIVEEAARIAKRNNVEIYRENDFLVTDLFPASITEGKHVLVIYKGETRQEYLDLKIRKGQLVASNQYTGEARKEIARQFGAMLSYPEWKIDGLIGNNSSG